MNFKTLSRAARVSYTHWHHQNGICNFVYRLCVQVISISSSVKVFFQQQNRCLI